VLYASEYTPLYGGNPIVSLAITAPGVLCILVVYYVLYSILPSSGGDYVYLSRLLNPSIALASNFSGWTFFYWFWIGDAAAVFIPQGLTQALTAYAFFNDQKWLLKLTMLATPFFIFVIGTIIIVMFSLIIIFSTRRYFLFKTF